MRRIAIIGNTASGKTTLAHAAAKKLGVGTIDLDELLWEPGWVRAAPEVGRARVEQASAAPGWVSAGNYQEVRDQLWRRADTVVWLDLPLSLIFYRLTVRTAHRALTRTKVCNGNVEGIRNIVARDSIFLWALQCHRRRRREYPAWFARPEYAHLQVHRWRRPSEVAAWLGTLEGP